MSKDDARHTVEIPGHGGMPAGRADQWLDAFFEAYFERRPVNATFIGEHRFDHLLPDFSESGAGDTVAEMRALLDGAPEVESIEDPTRAIDITLASGFLRTQLWEYGSGHFHRGNPSLYTGEAVFGVASLLLTEFAPLADRLERATERLNEIPRLLAEARANVRAAPVSWTDRALRECDGASALLGTGLGLLAARVPSHTDDLVHAAAVAETAFVEHREHLRETRMDGADAGVACGEEALSLYLRQGHFLDDSPDEVLTRARDGLAESKSLLEEETARIGASSPEDALRALADRHPSAEDYYDRYYEVWEEMRRVAIDRDLLTWPEFPIRFVPRPDWAREAAPHLYFLFYRSPAAFERPPVHDYLVTPIDESLEPDRQRELLRATNDAVIKLNHVIHHGGIGHHVQNWHAFRSRSRVGRIAAVDCASRIAMFCGGTMAEGWACYATDLMGEAGALSPLEEYAELVTRARMCARAAVDILLHTGRLDIEGATDFYRREAGMPAAAGHAEAVKNSMFPGSALMYQVGTDAIHQLRHDIQGARGEAFDLRRFHDEFLSYGSIPVSLISRAMKRQHAE